MHPVAAAGFAAAADVYERARPTYPPDAVAWLAERLGLGPGRTVLDVGAGTGKLTRLLVPFGARVIAVEPVPEMLAKLREVVPGTETMAATAEALPLPDASVDAITVAQAMHWFDDSRALPELRRVLRPGGALGLIWNSRDLADPLQDRLEALLAPARARVPAQIELGWREPLRRSKLFGPIEERRFRNEQPSTVGDLRDRVTSTSFVAAMAPVEREALLEQVEALVAGMPEPFTFQYETEVYITPAV
ncbi:MAG TPA: class I SAM-dependent methyltransferase [Gaiellaceae bacterium]|nr:class I SAM-dependent methyltransferase [Gaiellaceae bacterium]